jgi:hypothetical protein
MLTFRSPRPRSRSIRRREAEGSRARPGWRRRPWHTRGSSRPGGPRRRRYLDESASSDRGTDPLRRRPCLHSPLRWRERPRSTPAQVAPARYALGRTLRQKAVWYPPTRAPAPRRLKERRRRAGPPGPRRQTPVGPRLPRQSIAHSHAAGHLGNTRGSSRPGGPERRRRCLDEGASSDRGTPRACPCHCAGGRSRDLLGRRRRQRVIRCAS